MKTKLSALLLCVLLLAAAFPAEAAAGDADDPLISQSYIGDSFLPQVFSAMARLRETLTSDFAEKQSAVPSGWKTLQLSTGDTLHLGPGQQLVLLSGSVRFKVEKGTLLNVTAGRSSIGGDARIGNRYVLCGDSSVSVSVGSAASVSVSAGVAAPETVSPPVPPVSGGDGDGPFTDVAKSDWFYADVCSAYAKGLINGVTATTYEPAGSLTCAQAVKLAACMHQLYHSGSVTLKNAADGRDWYMSYVDYALKNGLMETGFQDYDGVIDRGGFIRLFYRALPESCYERINLIMDGAIPDVATDAPLAREVYTFYMAGILTGYSAGNGYLDHAFGPESTITRAEVAAVMNRMLSPEARVHFTMD